MFGRVHVDSMMNEKVTDAEIDPSVLELKQTEINRTWNKNN